MESLTLAGAASLVGVVLSVATWFVTNLFRNRDVVASESTSMIDASARVQLYLLAELDHWRKRAEDCEASL